MNAQAFDAAFGTVYDFRSLADYYRSRFQIVPVDPLDYDYPVGKLAELIGSVTHINLAAGTADITDNGETLHVAPHYCAHCNAIHGHEHDGEGDCIHKRALQFAIAAEEKHQNDLWDDAEEERRYAQAVGVGMG